MKLPLDEIARHHTVLQQATTELAKKEALKDLLVRLFGADDGARTAINDMSLGAEQAVRQIRLPSRIKTGRADTSYRNIIIEFEKDLKVPGVLAHAQDQLKEYVAGQWTTGKAFDYILIATDCTRWEVYGIAYDDLTRLSTAQLDVAQVALKRVAEFTLTAAPENHEAYFYFLDRWLFRTVRTPATLENFRKAFGEASHTFSTAVTVLRTQLDKVWDTPDTQTAYTQWNNFLQIAYGEFKGGKEAFVVHTFLSLFSKLLTDHLLGTTQHYDNARRKSILDGSIFREYQLDNYVEDDFFHWPGDDANFLYIVPALARIQAELADFDFRTVEEDILKGVYQELIDIDTRHALGEYYTPDWLCELVVNELPITAESRVLDPSCGSGSFLRVALERIKQLDPTRTPQQLADQIVGIDIHPLSVQIAKTNLIIGLSGVLNKTKKPVRLNIFLANTVFMPKTDDTNPTTQNLFNLDLVIQINEERIKVIDSFFENSSAFDDAIDVCNKLSDTYATLKKPDAPEIISQLEMRLGNTYSGNSIGVYYSIFTALLDAKKADKDRIWAYLLKNQYKPRILKGQFDIVVGNPPWVSYRYVTNKAYQDILASLADKYNIRPARQELFTQMEIAAIFLAHSTDYFLKKGGQLAFVLPRSFLSADQHDNIRNGKAKGFRLTEIWDLKGVSPLFNVPSSVLFASPLAAGYQPQQHYSTIKGLEISGKVTRHNAKLVELENRLTKTHTQWHYARLGNSSAFTQNAPSLSDNFVSFYKSKFKQGATIVPRSFYFIKPSTVIIDENDYKGGRFFVRTDPEALVEAKKPWNIEMAGMINSDFLFKTALSKNILPFVLVGPLPLMHLPAVVGKDGKIEMLENDQIRRRGYDDSSDWFREVENRWVLKRTERSNNMTSVSRLNYHNGISSQPNISSESITIIYNSSGKDCSALTFVNKTNEIPIISDAKTYYFNTLILDESDYILSYLNADLPNLLMKDFQSRGLFGPRDVHRKILDLPFPKYDPAEASHRALAALGAACRSKAEAWVKDNNIHNLRGPALGRTRTALRKHLAPELAEIDALLKDILGV